MNDTLVKELREKASRLKREASRLKREEGNLVGALETRLKLELIYDSFDSDVILKDNNLCQIANLAVHVGQFSEAERAARKSVSLTLPLDDKRRANSLSLLSAVLAESGKFEEAVIYGEQSVKLRESLFGADSSYVKYRKADLQRMYEKDTDPNGTVACY